ncbi:TDT family transporter [Vibrio mexicanus]|uniref:TDT family transporter n=1 Tax=Vibrio mexicanus TaxID=1004326 RepID=UPI00063CA471|nr:TDT family transporter [Vibrio mexicanus]
MIQRVKTKLMEAPTPMAGLALGIASLGWCWENLVDLNGYGQWVSAAISSILLMILAVKFLLHRHMLKEDLAHPVVGSVVPTFAMAVMIISNSIGQISPIAGDVIWLCAVFLHVTFLVSFLYHRAQNFELHHLVPSWFVPPVGIVVANVSYSGNPALEMIANGALIFGMLAYAIMLPLMIYRFMFSEQIPDTAKPTMAIMAAPASLTLAGYLSMSAEPSPVLIGLLFGIAVLMTMIIYLAFVRLLRLPFSAGYAAFTFPMVIGATALFKLTDWMTEIGMASKYINQVQTLAVVELVIATALVTYVGICYLYFYWPNRAVMHHA